jgi:hypothetical protein
MPPCTQSIITKREQNVKRPRVEFEGGVDLRRCGRRIPSAARGAGCRSFECDLCRREVKRMGLQFPISLAVRASLASALDVARMERNGDSAEI